jgi:tetratricopeptide (TPR) repeat protein
MNNFRLRLVGQSRTGVIVLGSTVIIAIAYLIAAVQHEQAIRQLGAGKADIARGDWPSALTRFDRALRFDRWLFEAHLLRGTAINEYIRSTGKRSPGRSREDALDDLGAYLSDRPNSGEAHYQRGLALGGLAKVEQARAAFARAIPLLGDPTKALVERAALSFHVGDYATAVKEVSGAIERHPLVAEYYESRALYRRFVSDQRGSITDTAKAERLRAAPDAGGITIEELKKLENLEEN